MSAVMSPTKCVADDKGRGEGMTCIGVKEKWLFSGRLIYISVNRISD
jgi:hypothetical protein